MPMQNIYSYNTIKYTKYQFASHIRTNTQTNKQILIHIFHSTRTPLLIKYSEKFHKTFSNKIINQFLSALFKNRVF